MATVIDTSQNAAAAAAAAAAGNDGAEMDHIVAAVAVFGEVAVAVLGSAVVPVATADVAVSDDVACEL